MVTKEDIRKMSDDEFRKANPFVKQSCDTCSHLRSFLSHWCGNKEAIEARGTRLPGVIFCPYWAADSKNKLVKQYVKDRIESRA